MKHYLSHFFLSFSFLVFSFFFFSCLFNANLYAKDFLPKTFQAKIRQISYGALSGKERVSAGEMDYSYPGELRFNILGSEKLTLVVGKELTWYYVPPFNDSDSGELTISKTKQTLIVSLLDSLSRGLKSNKLYTVKKENDLKYVLIFVKKEAQALGISSFEMTFKAKESTGEGKAKSLKGEKDLEEREFQDLKELLIFKTDNSKVKLEFLDVKQNLSFPKEHFVFTVPPKTRISQ